jgi:hypothetical protein
MASDAHTPQASRTPEGLTPLEVYRQEAHTERRRAEAALRDAMLKLENLQAYTLHEDFLVDKHGRFYTTDLSRARGVRVERVPIVAYGPRDIISEDVLERYPFIGTALGTRRGRLESIAFEEERLFLGLPAIELGFPIPIDSAFMDVRCYLDERGVILTRRTEAYRTFRGEREAVTTVKHGLPIETIADYLIAQGTPNHLIDEALTLIERRRSAHPE